MTYDPNRDPYNANRPTYAEESGGTALFIGALVLLALVFGGVYFYANERNPQVASEMTINNTPTTQRANPSMNPPAAASTAPESTPSAQTPAPQR